MLDLFTFMRQALAGRFTTVCEHCPTFSRINVYCGRDHSFSVAVDDNGYEIKNPAGDVLNKGTTFVEYTRYLKSQNQLASWMTVE
jgi:hypothetical protein